MVATYAEYQCKKNLSPLISLLVRGSCFSGVKVELQFLAARIKFLLSPPSELAEVYFSCVLSGTFVGSAGSYEFGLNYGVDRGSSHRFEEGHMPLDPNALPAPPA